MNSSSTLIGPALRTQPKGFLHLFSDSLLHSTLMIAVVALASVVAYKAVTLGVAVWLLEPVVVQGQTKPAVQKLPKVMIHAPAPQQRP